MSEIVELRGGVYHDSVTLLRISQAVTDADGVTAAQVAMATPLNMELAIGLGFAIPDGAGPNDLLVAIRGNDDAAVASGLAALDAALAAAEAAGRMSGGFGDAEPPRTVRTAATQNPDAGVVLLSIPGPSVIGEAMDAIGAGRHVMIFSDNVPIEHEIALKDAAAAAGVLVMGPDCGTAIVGGVGLGFANVVRSDVSAGSVPTVGIIAASGTGAQELTCLLDEAGVPISAVLGLGGRDMSERIGGRSALAALKMMQADPATDHILIVSKPPYPATAEKVLAAAAAGPKPVTTVLLGAGQPDLTMAAENVLAAIGVAAPAWPYWSADDGIHPSAGSLRGLYSGGTLADEAMLIAGEILGDIHSNIPLRPELALPASALGHGLPQLTGLGHVIVDLGDDEFTQGRPHPMIDPSVKLDLLAAQAADSSVTVILLDVVLGYGSDPDPAGRLAPAIGDAISAAATAGRDLTVIVSLCGSAADPQNREAVATALAHAGADVYLSNAAAARAAAHAARGESAAATAPAAAAKVRADSLGADAIASAPAQSVRTSSG
ncbi:MAG: hypothetical protein ABI382_04880, partial [Nakamurella sp.]